MGIYVLQVFGPVLDLQVHVFMVFCWSALNDAWSSHLSVFKVDKKKS